MIPGYLLSAFHHRQFHTPPGLLGSWAALPNFYPNACMPMQGGSLYHFYDGLWYDPAEKRTHDLPCERRTRYRLSQPDTVLLVVVSVIHMALVMASLAHYSDVSPSFVKKPMARSKMGHFVERVYQRAYSISVMQAQRDVSGTLTGDCSSL